MMQRDAAQIAATEAMQEAAAAESLLQCLRCEYIHTWTLSITHLHLRVKCIRWVSEGYLN